MPMTRESVLVSWLVTLLAGAVAALAIWLVAGQPEVAPFGFVIAAAARDAGSPRGCARRALRGAR